MKKRLFSLLLAVAMLLGLLPTAAFADSANIISEVEIWGLDMPIVGETPDYEGVLIGNPNYTITAPENSSVFTNGIHWYDMTADCAMQENDVFQADHEYQLTVSLKANDGYSFDAVENVRASVNLHETACALSFYGIDASQYITVTLGTASDFVHLTPLNRSSVTVTNGVAYNEDGDVITEAVEGDVVTVVGQSPSGTTQVFNGWFVAEPTGVEILEDNYTQMSFVMPDSDVTIIGYYEDIVLTNAVAALDKCVAGQEADFTPSNWAGNTQYIGYHFMDSQSFTNITFYNGVAWWDITDARCLEPGDVFERDHTYYAFVGIEPDNGYAFAEELNVSITHGGTCTASEEFGTSLEKGRVIQSAVITPISPYAINLIGGTAYDSKGNVITEAMPGDTVTLVAEEPGFGWKFDSWVVMGDAAVELVNATNMTTTFVMPEQDVTIFAGYTEAEKVPAEQINIVLRGYYNGASVKCMQVEASGGAVVQTNTTTNLKYALLADNNGKPGTTAITSGRIYRDSVYWMGLLLEPEFGYTLDDLTAAQITFSNGTVMSVSTNASGQTVLFVKLNAAPSLNSQGGAHTIAVTNGTAYVNNTAVTGAVSGMVVRLEADEAPEGSYFSHWEVLSDNVDLADIYNPSIYFTVGSEDTSFKAVHKQYISEVSVEILEPQAGMTPSYLASLDPAAAYMKDWNDNIYCRAGVIWYDVDTEENLDPKTAVFQNGHCYGVQILLRAKDGEQFLLDDYDYPAVTGCVNGQTDGVYVVQYAQDSAKQVMLTASFYLEEDAEIAEPVSQITLTELEPPVVGQPLCYTYSYDYMAFISCNSSYDGDHTLNGVTWTDITDPNNPIIMTPEVSVAEADRIYRVDMLLSPTNCKIFRLTAEGWPDVEATINGGPCTVSAVPGIPATHLLQLSYYMYTCSHDYPTVSAGGESATCTNCGQEVFAWAGMSVSLESSLQASFVVQTGKLPESGYYALIEKEVYDKETGAITIETTRFEAPDFEDYNTSGTMKKIVFSGVAAKQMTDRFTVTIYNADGEQISASYTRTIEEYILDLLSKDTTKAEMKTVAVDFLNYGAAAQDKFGYRTTELANRGLTDDMKALATADSAVASVTDDRTKGALLAGTAVSAEFEIIPSTVYQTSKIANVVKAEVSYVNFKGQTVSYEVAAEDFANYNTAGTMKKIEIKGTAVADGASPITVKLIDGSGNVVDETVECVNYYCARMAADHAVFTMLLKVIYSAKIAFA